MTGESENRSDEASSWFGLSRPSRSWGARAASREPEPLQVRRAGIEPDGWSSIILEAAGASLLYGCTASAVPSLCRSRGPSWLPDAILLDSPGEREWAGLNGLGQSIATGRHLQRRYRPVVLGDAATFESIDRHAARPALLRAAFVFVEAVPGTTIELGKARAMILPAGVRWSVREHSASFVSGAATLAELIEVMSAAPTVLCRASSSDHHRKAPTIGQVLNAAQLANPLRLVVSVPALQADEAESSLAILGDTAVEVLE